MFSHIRVGSSQLEKSRTFYDAALGALGIPAGADMFGGLAYRNAGNNFMVGNPLEGAASASNGGTIGFNAATPEQVDRFHEAGLAHGGTCEGKPGQRAGGAFYAAYLRDPDGNKICAMAR